MIASLAWPRAMARSAAAYVAAGYRRIQVKVGGEPAEDVERVRAVRAAVPSGVVLFCDANGAWTTGQARAFLRATADEIIEVSRVYPGGMFRAPGGFDDFAGNRDAYLEAQHRNSIDGGTNDTGRCHALLSLGDRHVGVASHADVVWTHQGAVERGHRAEEGHDEPVGGAVVDLGG